MHNHEAGNDPFDDFARRDLEEKGVDPETAERVVQDTYEPAAEAGSRPWRMADEIKNHDERFIYDENGSVVGSLWPHGEAIDRDDGTRDANAALIVRAVNSHDQLVDALEALTAFAALYTGNGANRDESELADIVSNDPDQWVDLARAALAKARGES